MSNDNGVTPKKKKKGRPTKYSEELDRKICHLIAKGNSLNSIGKRDEMPTLDTLILWLQKNETFLRNYTRAKQDQTEMYNEVIADIGDEAIRVAQTVDPKVANAVVNAYKMKADNLRWVMARMKPRKYGNSLDVTSAGERIVPQITIPVEIAAKNNLINDYIDTSAEPHSEEPKQIQGA